MRLLGIVLVTVFVCLALYVRLVPSDPARWHVSRDETSNKDFDGGAIRLAEAGEGGLARLHDIALTTPRTRVLAGSVEEGMITYITRSAVFRFPDYTTVDFSDGKLRLYGRLRFGKLDMGVNAARIDGWLAELARSGG